MYLKYVIKNLFLFIFILNLITFSSYSISENIETPIEIANPIFTTKGVNELPYTIKASLGIQQGDDLELFEIEGKIKNRDNIWIYINADKGNYNQISQVVYLLNNVEVYTDEEERLLSDEAIIDIKEDTITLISNVKYNNKDNKIEADRSIITNKFKSFEYFGNVQTKISN
tara:strand:- start:100 stop:612 length:513 start_codon:yes stop_codon:yes gene_type:complete